MSYQFLTDCENSTCSPELAEVSSAILLGHTCVCAVEIEPYCRKVLLQRQRDGVLPKFPIWDDVRTFDGRPWRGRVDVVCGGFPCQASPAAAKVQASREREADYGERWRECVGKLERNSASWKIPTCFQVEGLAESLRIFPPFWLLFLMPSIPIDDKVIAAISIAGVLIWFDIMCEEKPMKQRKDKEGNEALKDSRGRGRGVIYSTITDKQGRTKATVLHFSDVTQCSSDEILTRPELVWCGYGCVKKVEYKMRRNECFKGRWFNSKGESVEI